MPGNFKVLFIERYLPIEVFATEVFIAKNRLIWPYLIIPSNVL
jgi:hypothetical protein